MLEAGGALMLEMHLAFVPSHVHPRVGTKSGGVVRCVSSQVA